MKTIFNLLFLTPLFFTSSLCLAQLADVEGTIRSNTQTPKMELFDSTDDRIEASWEEFDHEIFLYSKYGDLQLGASDDGSNRTSTFMTLKSDNQRVGINTEDPTSALQVNVAGSDRSIGLTGITQFWKDSAEVLGSVSHVFDAMLIQNQKTPASETVATFTVQAEQTDGTAPLQIFVDGLGDVGIGGFSTHPQAAVHLKHRNVVGLANRPSEGIRFESDGLSGNHMTFYLDNTDGFMEIYSKEAGDAYIAIINDVTGAYSSVSDARLKNDIQSLDLVLEKVKLLNPVSYFYNHQEDQKERYSGFLAQELNTTFPEFVTYSKEKDQYGVDYAGLSTIAIKAIQEQQVLMDAQKQQIDELVLEINSMKNNYGQQLDRIELLLNK